MLITLNELHLEQQEPVRSVIKQMLPKTYRFAERRIEFVNGVLIY